MYVRIVGNRRSVLWLLALWEPKRQRKVLDELFISPTSQVVVEFMTWVFLDWLSPLLWFGIHDVYLPLIAAKRVHLAVYGLQGITGDGSQVALWSRSSTPLGSRFLLIFLYSIAELKLKVFGQWSKGSYYPIHYQKQKRFSREFHKVNHYLNFFYLTADLLFVPTPEDIQQCKQRNSSRGWGQITSSWKAHVVSKQNKSTCCQHYDFRTCEQRAAA